MADPSSNRKSKLSAAKRALLAQRLKGKTKAATPAIPRRPADAVVPLSFSQQRLWFLYQFEPDNPFYNVPFGLHLKGTLDIAALKQVVQAITQRHEILRTTFADGTGEQTQQIIHPKSSTTLQQIDLSAFGEQAWTEAKRMAQKEAQAPFNLHQGPLLRVTLLTLADQEFVLLVTLHHIISDVWSTGVLVREMATLYHAFSQGKEHTLMPLPIQYADFTLWQRQRLQGERLEKQIRYWQQQFATLPPVLQLPTDRPRPAVQTFHGNHRDFFLSTELTTGLKDLSQAADATLFMTLLAAFKVLLYRYTGQSDITVGSPIANRNEAAIEGLIGLFMNTLALRTQLGDNPTFRDLLSQVREVALGAYNHQDLPFEKLIEVLKLPRNLSHPPLFQVMVILQNAPSPTLQLPGLTLSGLNLVNTTAKFDLTLIVTEIEDRLQCILEYNTDLFEATTIDRLASHFQTLLMGIVANPDTRLHDLPLLTAEESTQLHQWAQTETKTIPQLCLHQLFETQAEKTPRATAVIFEQTSLTYDQLNKQSNQLAHHLQILGVGPETLVGICVERSLEMLVGVLAILKAGGAYVPMDPSYPSSRLQFMFSDARISVLLSQSHLLNKLPSLEAKIVLLDRDESNIAQSSTEPLSIEITPESLAYVIYTSGSTGRPKGVMIPHQGLVNYLSWAVQAYKVATGGGAPVHSSLGFDATITGLFAPLLVGKPVVLLSPQQEIESLCQALQSNQQFSLVKLTPAHLELLNQMLPPETLADQSQALVIGGEALMGHQLTFWQTHASNTRLINEYGPTETVVGCCVYETDETTDLTGAIPIGRPIANTQLYVLDAYQQRVPVGVAGELHIGGNGVARGYLNRPELTRERFIDSPFGKGRLYKTGDLVRYRPDGVLDYLGRIDHQVKIRGFRIELGEIETALLQHPQILEAVAIAREDKPGQKQLVAYLTLDKSSLAEEQQAPAIGDLRQWLQDQLPDHMIPAAFVWLDHIPLTANGKVDRQALPAPQIDRSSLTAQFTAPRSQLEQQLATIWSNVLDVNTIGIDDNFFELGGDSILSLQIITQANQAGLKLTLKQLFQHQTIRTLAPVVEPISSAEQGPVTGPVPLTSMQRWLLDQRPTEGHHSCQWLHLKIDNTSNAEPLTLESLQTTIQHLLNHHDALRLAFQPGDQEQRSAWTQHNNDTIPSMENLP
ncbi:MAG: amino acid adenylation domain-containing protein, partial [Cyanobacteria bacterium P01_F01_bin.116]